MDVAESVAALSWSTDEAPRALRALAARSGLARAAEPSGDERATWPIESTGDVEEMARALGLELEAVVAPRRSMPACVRYAAPALLRVEVHGEPRLLAVLGLRWGRVLVVAPSSAVHRLPVDVVGAALTSRIDGRHTASVEALLAAAGPRGWRARRRVRARLLVQLAGDESMNVGWLVQRPAAASQGAALLRAGIVRRLFSLLFVHGAVQSLWVGSWWLLAAAAAGGRIEDGRASAWALAICSIVVLRALTSAVAGAATLDVGLALRHQRVASTLRGNRVSGRHAGAASVLGRSFEADAFEAYAVAAGITLLTTTVDLALGVWVVWHGAAGALHVALAIVWVAALTLTAAAAHAVRVRWARARRVASSELTERLVGHRTRSVQAVPERWHDGEEEVAASYARLSLRLDQSQVLMHVGAPRGWTFVGLAALLPAVLDGGVGSVALAVSIGGILLCQQAFRSGVVGLEHLSAAVIAWRESRELLAHVAAGEASAPRVAMPPVATPPRDAIHLEARDVSVRFAPDRAPVLQKVNLSVGSGDRLLIQGASGSGKSTLAGVLAARHVANDGLMLLDGLDVPGHGVERWRRRVVLVPQFHENHLFLASFGYNLLLGRRWPPSPEDVDAARSVCTDLGLDDLIRRMPSGLDQMVGETGWQLSHGERSRVFLARGLLQDPDVLICDESFASLDPESLHLALDAAMRRARTLIVVAHP